MAGGAIFQLQDIHPSHYGHLFPNDRFDKKKKKKKSILDLLDP